MSSSVTVEERPGCGLGARLAARLFKVLLRPAITWMPWTPFVLRLAPLLDVACVVLVKPRRAKVAKVRELPCPAEWVRGRGVTEGSRQVVLYFHGGGFVACGLRSHRRMIARISAAAGMPALSVAYRMQPRVPIETSIADCVAAYRWLLEQGYAAGDIVIAGDSAGGYFSFAAPLHAMREGLPRPAGIAALSPFTDLDIDAKVAHANAVLDPFIPAHRMHDMVRICFPETERTDPWLCPVHADLSALPPTLIQAGSIEVLLADAELMAERLAAAGVRCTLQVWEGQMHVFQIFADLAREGFAAIEEIGAFARSATATAASASASASASTTTPAGETAA